MSTLPDAPAPPPTLDEVVAQIFRMLDDNIETMTNAAALFPASSATAAMVEPHGVVIEGPAPVALVGVHVGGAPLHG